jgi:hypothetical protein
MAEQSSRTWQEETVAQVIDFSKLGGPVYAGRASGALARQRLKIDALDAEQEPVRVLIPEQTYAVNSSYFLTLFGPSLACFESRGAFLKHYRFEGPRHVLELLPLFVDRGLALRARRPVTASTIPPP